MNRTLYSLLRMRTLSRLASIVGQNTETNNTDRHLLADGQRKSSGLSFWPRDDHSFVVDKCQPDRNPLKRPDKADLIDDPVGQRLIFLDRFSGFLKKTSSGRTTRFAGLPIRKTHIVIEIDRDIFALKTSVIDRAGNNIRRAEKRRYIFGLGMHVDIKRASRSVRSCLDLELRCGRRVQAPLPDHA